MSINRKKKTSDKLLMETKDQKHSPISWTIAFCVLFSNLSSFFCTSLRRSQLGFFGAIFRNGSWVFQKPRDAGKILGAKTLYKEIRKKAEAMRHLFLLFRRGRCSNRVFEFWKHGRSKFPLLKLLIMRKVVAEFHVDLAAVKNIWSSAV